MKRTANVVLVLLGLFFSAQGTGWLIAPDKAGAQLGLAPETGVGLSSQIGDMSSFFLTMGACMLLAGVTQRNYWLYPPIMMLGLAALGRVIAWQLYGAPFTTVLIAVEVIVALLLSAVVARRTEC